MTERELNKVGKMPYINFLRLIKAFRLSDGGKNKGLLTIPKSEVTAIDGLNLEESIKLLVQNFVLEKFVVPGSEWQVGDQDEYVSFRFEENDSRRSGAKDDASDENIFDLKIQCRMSAEELDHHIEELRKLGNIVTETKTMSSVPPQFNAEISRLSFRGKDIQISKKEYSNPNKLLRALLLLGTTQRRWNYDEIWEEGEFGEGEYKPKRDMQSIYQAAKDVNEKVFKATQVEKFLDFNTTSVMVNPSNIP